MTNDDFVTAYAPASIGNVAVGYDMLGLALDGAGDKGVRAKNRREHRLSSEKCGALMGNCTHSSTQIP